MLQLRYGLQNNYDHLAATLDRARQIKNALAAGPYAVAGRGDREIDEALAALASALDEKDALIEKFKARNALLRNSVHYLPVAVESAVSDAPTRGMRDDVRAVLHETLLVQVGASENDHSHTVNAIAALAKHSERSSPSLRANLDKVLLHARHIVQHQQEMDKLIPAVTTEARLGSELTLAYGRSFENHLARTNAYRLWLLLASVALLVYAGYTFVRLRENAKKLAESESRYRSVVAAIAEGVVVRDKAGLITACNASAERILGRSLQQMEGHSDFDSSWKPLREDGSDFPAQERPARGGVAHRQAPIERRGRFPQTGQQRAMVFGERAVAIRRVETDAHGRRHFARRYHAAQAGAGTRGHGTGSNARAGRV